LILEFANPAPRSRAHHQLNVNRLSIINELLDEEMLDLVRDLIVIFSLTKEFDPG